MPTPNTFIDASMHARTDKFSSDPGHRIGVCSWSLSPKSPADLITSLQQLNINTVQLALTPVVKQSEIWGDAIEQLQSSGVQIISGMMAMEGEDYSTLESIARTGGVRPDHTWIANRKHAMRVASEAQKGGVRLVTFHAGFIPEEPMDPERGKLIQRLREIADIFSARGIRLALETGQETAQTLLEALAELDHPIVGVNFDPANMILYGKGDPIDALRQLGPYVRQIHVKDALPSAAKCQWGAEVAVGTGAVRWDEFFDIAHELKPGVDFVIEREAGATRERDIVAARDLVIRSQARKRRENANVTGNRGTDRKVSDSP